MPQSPGRGPANLGIEAGRRPPQARLSERLPHEAQAERCSHQRTRMAVRMTRRRPSERTAPDSPAPASSAAPFGRSSPPSSAYDNGLSSLVRAISSTDIQSRVTPCAVSSARPGHRRASTDGQAGSRREQYVRSWSAASVEKARPRRTPVVRQSAIQYAMKPWQGGPPSLSN